MPPVDVHVTAEFEVFVTVAVNCCDSPIPNVAPGGDKLTMGPVSTTDTTAFPKAVGSATLVAVMVTLSTTPGAVRQGGIGLGRDREHDERPVELVERRQAEPGIDRSAQVGRKDVGASGLRPAPTGGVRSRIRRD